MEDHEHRFYLNGKTYTDFVPFDKTTTNGRFDGIVTLYVRNEYAILSCLCGEVKRVLVKDA